MKQDPFGNKIEVRGGRITLHLPSRRKRLIGTIDDSRKVLAVKRKRERHLLRANNSYGFNDFVLRNAKRFDAVDLTDEYGTFNIPIKRIIEFGTYLQFKAKGFEKQLFLNINYLTPYKQNGARENSEQL